MSDNNAEDLIHFRGKCALIRDYPLHLINFRSSLVDMFQKTTHIAPLQSTFKTTNECSPRRKRLGLGYFAIFLVTRPLTTIPRRWLPTGQPNSNEVSRPGVSSTGGLSSIGLGDTSFGHSTNDTNAIISEVAHPSDG
ncbi:hypothetical protein BJ912DRAFT_1072165 [Pholiota molesta]|nr:hypothetical protein BJ912DRAFT_1072165 [Pholiota molesta]